MTKASFCSYGNPEDTVSCDNPWFFTCCQYLDAADKWFVNQGGSSIMFLRYFIFVTCFIIYFALIDLFIYLLEIS